MKSALLVIDVQRDFCPGGALEVRDGDAVVPVINRISREFATVVATRDWHPADHISFASSHPGKKVLETVYIGGITQVLWPAHCMAGSPGADFHPELDHAPISLIVHKGKNSGMDSYSAFFENDRKTSTGLAGWLRELGIQELAVCGLATDYCVKFSVLDALALGFQVRVVSDAVRGVDLPAGSADEALREMRERGASVMTSENLHPSSVGQAARTAER